MTHFIAFEDINFILIYFPRDKQFVVYEIGEIMSWCLGVYESLLLGSNKKVFVDTTYDGVNEKAVVVQVGRTEEDLDAALAYVRLAKQRKRVPIETLLKQVDRFRPTGRQHFPPIEVQCSQLMLNQIRRFRTLFLGYAHRLGLNMLGIRKGK